MSVITAENRKCESPSDCEHHDPEAQRQLQTGRSLKLNQTQNSSRSRFTSTQIQGTLIKV